MEIIKKIILYLLITCFSLVLCYYLGKNGVLITLLVIAGIIHISEKFNFKRFWLLLFIISFVVRVIIILVIDTPITSDFAVMYNTARQLLSDDMSYTTSGYIITWGYQMGHTIYMTMLLKIIDSVIFLKIVNCLFTVGITVLIYLIAKEIASEKASKIVSLLYVFFPFPLLLNTVLTNQHVSLFFILLALYILIGKRFMNINPYFKNIMVGIFLAIANIIRPEIIVIITSLIIYLFVTSKKNNYKQNILGFVIILVTYFIIFNTSSTLLVKTNISPSGLENKNPVWKFVLGFNHETNGVYSPSDASKYSGINKQDIAKEELMERSLGSIERVPVLFLKKSVILWTNHDLKWSVGSFKYQPVLEKKGDFNIFYNVINNINQIMIISILIMFLLGVIYYLKNKKSEKALLFMIIVLVYFGVYLLIEIAPRYAYAPQAFLFIISALGYDYLRTKIKINK
ncbi:MAG: glycosyltransferase family 39 protein [Bacilli bacterium]|nr:glycosyltransferase family 39 protein [Bacilli bacterium]